MSARQLDVAVQLFQALTDFLKGYQAFKAERDNKERNQCQSDDEFLRSMKIRPEGEV